MLTNPPTPNNALITPPPVVVVPSSSYSSSSSSQLIANAEIPIWVSDKKKWVTGISKKTTINDLIFAILKQCQIVLSNENNNNNNTLNLIGGGGGSLLSGLNNMQYVLVEYNFEPSSDLVFNSNENNNNQNNQQVVLSSQRILNGDSKVYKFLSKWSYSGQQLGLPLNVGGGGGSNNLMLKILQKQAYECEQNNNNNNVSLLFI